jgi:hypothetical protein
MLLRKIFLRETASFKEYLEIFSNGAIAFAICYKQDSALLSPETQLLNSLITG